MGGYRLFAVSWFLVVVSKQIENVAVGWVVLKRTGDPLALGISGLVQAAPVMLLAMVGGQLADRLDRRRVLMASLALGVLSSLGMVAVTTWKLPAGWIYALLVVSATGAALGQPSRAALVPSLVEADVFPNAVAWSMSVFQTATLVGPAIGGLLLWIDIPTVFLVGAIGRTIAILLVSRLRPRAQPRLTEPVTFESLLSGARFVWRTQAILGAVMLDMVAVMLGGFTYLLPIFAQDVLRVGGVAVGEVGLGLLRSAEAVGALVMALALVHLPPFRRAGRAMLAVVAAFGLGVIAFGLSRSFWFSLAVLLFLGAVDNVSVVIRHTLIQTLTPDEMRGRVSAINNVFIVASNDLGGFESGVAARLLGAASRRLGRSASDDEARASGAIAAVILGGIGTLAVVAIAAASWPELRRIRSLQDLKPLPPEGGSVERQRGAAVASP